MCTLFMPSHINSPPPMRRAPNSDQQRNKKKGRTKKTIDSHEKSTRKVDIFFSIVLMNVFFFYCKGKRNQLDQTVNSTLHESYPGSVASELSNIQKHTHIRFTSLKFRWIRAEMWNISATVSYVDARKHQ